MMLPWLNDPRASSALSYLREIPKFTIQLPSFSVSGSNHPHKARHSLSLDVAHIIFIVTSVGRHSSAWIQQQSRPSLRRRHFHRPGPWSHHSQEGLPPPFALLPPVTFPLSPPWTALGLVENSLKANTSWRKTISTIHGFWFHHSHSGLASLSLGIAHFISIIPSVG